MAKEGTRKGFKIVEGSELVSEWPAKHKEATEEIENLNEGQQDYLQAGIVGSGSWSFTASINSSTAAMASTGEVAESIAWLPDPDVSGALMRAVNPKASVSSEVSPVKPSSGKYVTVAYELVPSKWGGAATVKLHAGTEQSSGSEAIAHAPATTSGRIQIRRATILNTSGVYSIVVQEDVRPWAGTAMQLAPTSQYSVFTERTLGIQYEPSATRPVFVTLRITGESEYPMEGAFVHVGGVEVAVVYAGPPRSGVPPILPFSFICPASAKWYVDGAATMVESSYLVM